MTGEDAAAALAALAEEIESAPAARLLAAVAPAWRGQAAAAAEWRLAAADLLGAEAALVLRAAGLGAAGGSVAGG